MLVVVVVVVIVLVLLFRLRLLLCIHTRREHKFESKLKINRFIAHEIFHSSPDRPAGLSHLVFLSCLLFGCFQQCSVSAVAACLPALAVVLEREPGDHHNKRLARLGGTVRVSPSSSLVSKVGPKCARADTTSHCEM